MTLETQLTGIFSNLAKNIWNFKTNINLSLIKKTFSVDARCFENLINLKWTKHNKVYALFVRIHSIDVLSYGTTTYGVLYRSKDWRANLHLCHVKTCCLDTYVKLRKIKK